MAYQQYPGEIGNSNPNYSMLDSTFVRGGGRTVPTLTGTTGLYSLSGKTDQLSENITKVWVVSEQKNYVLINMINVGNADGWSVDTVDLSDYYTTGETNSLLLGKSDTGHTHSQYLTGYTETNPGVYTSGRTDVLLLSKSDTGHTHEYLSNSGGTLTGNLTGTTFYGSGAGLYSIPTSGVTNLFGINTGDERYSNLTPTDSVIGGIPVGSTFSGKTVQQMFDSLLYPTLNPSFSNPSSTFTVSVNPYYEVGQLIPSLSFSSTFNRGTITPAYGTSGFRSGLPTRYNYSGYQLSGVTSSGLTNTVTISDYVVVVGSQSWSGSVTYLSGEQPLNNKGDFYLTGLTSGTTSNSSRSFNGIYPFLYGMSDLILMSTTAYGSLSGKLLEVQGNKLVTLNGNIKYIYFIYPSSYSDLSSIIDQNGFNVTGSFQKTTMNVISTNWTTIYKVYRTINMTSVLNGQFEFKFN